MRVDHIESLQDRRAQLRGVPMAAITVSTVVKTEERTAPLTPVVNSTSPKGPVTLEQIPRSRFATLHSLHWRNAQAPVGRRSITVYRQQRAEKAQRKQAELARILREVAEPAADPLNVAMSSRTADLIQQAMAARLNRVDEEEEEEDVSSTEDMDDVSNVDDEDETQQANDTTFDIDQQLESLEQILAANNRDASPAVQLLPSPPQRRRPITVDSERSLNPKKPTPKQAEADTAAPVAIRSQVDFLDGILDAVAADEAPPATPVVDENRRGPSTRRAHKQQSQLRRPPKTKPPTTKPEKKQSPKLTTKVVAAASDQLAAQTNALDDILGNLGIDTAPPPPIKRPIGRPRKVRPTDAEAAPSLAKAAITKSAAKTPDAKRGRPRMHIDHAADEVLADSSTAAVKVKKASPMATRRLPPANSPPTVVPIDAKRPLSTRCTLEAQFDVLSSIIDDEEKGGNEEEQNSSDLAKQTDMLDALLEEV